jgi:hypothetical protein
MKHIVSFLSLFFFFLVSILAQEGAIIKTKLEWGKTFSFDSIQIPSSITGSNLEGYVSAKPDSLGGVVLLFSNTHLYRPYSIYMIHLNDAGLIIDSARISGPSENIPTMPLELGNCFYLDQSFWDWEKDKYLKKITVVDNNFAVINKEIPDYLISASKLNDYYLTLNSFFDSIGNVFGNQKPYNDSIAYLVKTYDFKNAASILPVAVSSQILDEFEFKSYNSNIVGYLNNTILRGPDHHDIHIYYLDKKLNLIWHRAITSISKLGRLTATDIVLQEDGCVAIAGNANDYADFESHGQFNQAAEKDSFYTYSFFAVYEQDGKMRNLSVFDKDYESMYNAAFYSILHMNNQMAILNNRNLPEILQINTTENKINRIALAVNPIKGVEYKNEQYLFIKPQIFFRIAIVNGSLNTNKPPTYIVEKYSLNEPVNY